MGLSFEEIITSYRTVGHHVEFDKSRAKTGVNSKPHRILVCGIKLAAGSVAELVRKQLLSATGLDAEGYWGTGSQIAEMVRFAKKANPYTEMWGVAIDEAVAGTAGTKTLTVTGPATADGTIKVYIGGRKVEVSVANADAQNDIATAIDTAIKAHKDYDRMPFTSGVASNAVTLTKRWKGIMDEDVRVNYYADDALPAGVAIAVATGTTGATNPEISEIITAIGDATQYDTIIIPWTDATNLSAIESELDDRWGGMVMMEGAAYAAVSGTYSTATTLTLSRNSPFLRVMACNESPTPSYCWAASVGATNALAAQLAPARPRATLSLPDVLPAVAEKVWGESDRNLLLYAGASTHVVDAGGNVTIEKMITTYRENAQAVLDESYLLATTLDTLAAIRYDLRTSVSTRYPRYYLADDSADNPTGQPIMTPGVMKGHVIGRYDVWVGQAWVEAAAKQQFIDELYCDRSDVNTNRLEMRFTPDLINQFDGLDAICSFII